MMITFNGRSWFIGVLCAAAYYGETSPWWLMVIPLFLIKLREQRDNGDG